MRGASKRGPDLEQGRSLHIHSDRSDGLASIPQIMEHVATKTDLSVIAITDHNTIEGALFAKSLEELYPGLEVIVGEEVTSKSVSYTHLRAHETRHDLVCRL